MTDLCIGVDMGGTFIKIAVVDSDAKITEESVLKTDINAVPAAVIKDIAKICRSFKSFNKVKSIGIGIAGDVDFKKGVLRFSPNLPKWKNIKIKSLMEKLTKKTVNLDNDANTAAIGAYWLDIKGKADNMICVTLGTGVGGGIIINRKLFRGNSGTAGEIGHITVEPYGKQCNCGNTGCAETYIGVRHLVNDACKMLKQNKNKSKYIMKLAEGDIKNITPKLLSQAAKKGDIVAKQIWDKAGERLGIMLADLINLMNPDNIVLCGGISLAGDIIMKPAYKQIQERAFKTAVKACKIKISKYTSRLGVVGAAMLNRN